MAQKKSSGGRPSGARKTGAGAGRKTGGAGRPSSGSAGARRPAGKSGGKKAAAKRRRARQKPVRREVGSLVLLFAGIVALIAWFPAEGWLVDAWRSLARGLAGWGYYIAPVSLLWASWVLGMHRGRPVALRVTCILLLPVAFGAFMHALKCQEPFTASFPQLWDSGQYPAEYCGGVLGGLLGGALRGALSKLGAFLVLLAGLLLLCIEGLNLSLPAIIAAIRAWYNRHPRLLYEPEEDDYEEELIDERDRLNPEDYLFPLDGRSPIRRAADARRVQQQQKQAAKIARARRRVYDDDWEEKKDDLFSAFEIDPGARQRVTAALQDEQRASRERLTAEAAARAVKTVRPVPQTEPTPPADAADTDGGAPAETPPAPAPAETPPAQAPAPRTAVPAQDVSRPVTPPVPEAETGKKGKKFDRDAEAALVAAQIAAAEDAADTGERYVFPDTSLLNKSSPGAGQARGLDDGEARLEAAIRSYGVGATITGAVRGPSITRYELRLDQGVKLSKIENLGKDIALSLGVESVRIAPIPDKISTVGVEVPNRDRTTVWLGDLIDSDVFRASKSLLSVAMGKDIAGNVIVGNIAKMPHVLIAGTTGSGKSVCVNSMILSLLYKASPQEVRMIMIDPKMVEFVVYNDMPHLYVPVVTDPKKAAGALQWAVIEMLRRYRLFSETGVRDLAGYNAVLQRDGARTLPQVVIFIDELADLMMIAAKEVEESICRVAQMGRAAGMHLVVATQSPRADVITGLMKANIPSRIALSVASSLESRIILDQQGAESLVGNGDMLFAPIGRKPTRVQGAFVTDEEREAIIDFVKGSGKAEYSQEILAEIERAAQDGDKGDRSAAPEEESGREGYDELLPQAVEVIFETKQASASMLQRRLKLGYARAARLVDQLEEVGVVGPYEGSKPRRILLTREQWQEMQYVRGTAPTDSIAEEFSAVAASRAFSPEPAAEEGDGVLTAGAPGEPPADDDDIADDIAGDTADSPDGEEGA